MLLKSRQLATALRKKMGNHKQASYVAELSKRGFEINQSTLSRLLNRQYRRATPKLKALCNYAGLDISDFVRKQNPNQSKRLMSALEQAWDGSKAHERWLARVIATAGAAPE